MMTFDVSAAPATPAAPAIPAPVAAFYLCLLTVLIAYFLIYAFVVELLGRVGSILC